MAKIRVNLGELQLGLQGNRGVHFREFTANIKRVGEVGGQILSASDLLQVNFLEASELENVDLAKSYSDGADYVEVVRSARHARKAVSRAVKIALRASEPQTAEELPPLGVGMEN